MFGLRMQELIIIFLIVFLLFGAKKLPQLGAGLGQAIRGFKKSFDGQEEPKAEPPPAQQASANPTDGASTTKSA